MRISFGAALSDEARSAVVPPPLCKTCRWCRRAWWNLLLPMFWLFPMFWHGFWEQARCRHPTSLYRLPADYVTGRREKPRRMACNSARGHDRDRCGPQAHFWEARRYPPWVWMIASVGAGLIIIIAYIACFWDLPGVVRPFVQSAGSSESFVTLVIALPNTAPVEPKKTVGWATRCSGTVRLGAIL